MTTEITKTSNATIAINRAAPLFKQASELQERVMFDLVKYKEATSDLIAKAREIGSYLEQAAITLRESDTQVKFDDVLHMHAPNINAWQAKRYRGLHKGELDPRQMWLLGLEQKPLEIEDAKPERAHPAEWEQAWGFVRKLQRVEWDKWPEEQRTLTRDNLGAVVKHFGGSVVWE